MRGNIPRRKSPRCELGYLKPLVRRPFVERSALAFNPADRFAADYRLYPQALAAGARFTWIAGPGYVAELTPGSLSHQQSARDYQELAHFDKDLARGRGSAETQAFHEHTRLMRLKAQYLRIEAELACGRWRSAARMALRDRATAGYVCNHRFRPVLSRAGKRLLGVDPGRDLLGQLPAFATAKSA